MIMGKPAITGRLGQFSTELYGLNSRLQVVLAIAAYFFHGQVLGGPQSAADTLGRISGIGTDKATGQPLAGAVIYLYATLGILYPKAFESEWICGLL